jgi:glycosyltransferase involved in cell wall biosynthesis
MRVCIIAYTFYEIDHRVRRYAEALVERGDTVDAIVLRREGQRSREVFNGVNVSRIQQRSYNERKLLDYVVRIGTFFLKGILILLGRQFKKRYDVIHIHNVPEFLIFMGAVPKFFGTRLILDIHDILPEFYAQKFKSGMNSILVRILLYLEKVSVRFADYVIVANDLWRDKIIARDGIAPNTCMTMLNYPDLGFFQKVLRKEGGPLSLIYPGTISHHHGLDIAIKALAIVKKDIPDIQLSIYTRSNNFGYFVEIQKLIGELQLGENVRILDPVPTERLWEIYSKADIGIVPKRGGIFADEAFSTKIFDFFAAGLPVIASKTRIDQYYFDDSMIKYFKPENYEEMACCIKELAMDSAQMKSLVEEGRKFIVENNWETKKCAYLQIIDRLVDGKGT